MRYIYLISFSCMLAGCGEPLTLEQVENAKKYCVANSASVLITTGFTVQPNKVYCRKDGNYLYEVSRENMK